MTLQLRQLDYYTGPGLQARIPGSGPGTTYKGNATLCMKPCKDQVAMWNSKYCHSMLARPIRVMLSPLKYPWIRKGAFGLT